MATDRSFGDMLNPYTVLQQEKAKAKDLTSQRERIRNEMIDAGVKPTEEQIDAVLLKSNSEVM